MGIVEFRNIEDIVRLSTKVVLYFFFFFLLILIDILHHSQQNLSSRDLYYQELIYFFLLPNAEANKEFKNLIKILIRYFELIYF